MITRKKQKNNSKVKNPIAKKKVIRNKKELPKSDFIPNTITETKPIVVNKLNNKKQISSEEEPFVTTNGKLIKRKIKRKKPGSGPSKTYFTSDTQDAIIAVQKEKDQAKKDKIYSTEILPAFDSLVENLINVYGFKVQYDSKEDLKNEALEFLHRTIPKYDHTKNTKAFSYFNVVARNWLTIQSKKNAKRIQQYVSLDDTENISASDAEKIESYNLIASYDEVVSSKELKIFTKKAIDAIKVKCKTTNEKAVLSAVEDILNNLDNLEFLNKRALLIYVREISQLNSKQLSMSLSNLKKQYKELKKLEEFNY